MSRFNSIRYSSLIRVARAGFVVLLALGLLNPAAALAHPPGVTELVSISSDGVEANNQNFAPAISADGRFVAFASIATNLVPDDTNGFADTFVHDRHTGITERISVDSHGREGNNDGGVIGGSAGYPAINTDGRFIAFVSLADNLVSGDKNQQADVFVRDRLLGTTKRVSVASDGKEANGISEGPAISADGRFIAFQSDANNLPGGNPFQFMDQIFVHDRETGTTEIISVNSAGESGNSDSIRPDISNDGRFVVFMSSATNLTPGSAFFGPHIFLVDRMTGTIERISEDAAGNPGDGRSELPKVSADGRFVAFETNTGNLIGDGNHESHILVKDRVTGAFERMSATSTGEPGNFLSEHPDITPDGRFVTFFSLASNLVPDDTNSLRDIFVRDRQTGTVERVSVNTAGEQLDLSFEWPTISDNGLVTAFEASQIFVHDDRPAADLSVTKSDSPDPTTKGANLTYSIVVTNIGPILAADVQLTDTLPANVQFVSAISPAGGCVQAGNTVSCNLGDLSNGASVTVTIIVTPKKAGTITNTAQVSSLSPDPNAANNTDIEETTVVAR